MKRLETLTVVPAGSMTPLMRLATLYRDRLPAPVRFLGVGMAGLATDMLIYALLDAAGLHHLAARALSLLCATFVTWRLNRALTFGASNRRQREEAVRYGLVTLVAQGSSYLTFALLMALLPAIVPQLAILAGAAVGTVLSYTGHSLFSFAPAVRTPAS